MDRNRRSDSSIRKRVRPIVTALITGAAACCHVWALPAPSAERIFNAALLEETISATPEVVRYQYGEEYRILAPMQGFYLMQAVRFAYNPQWMKKDILDRLQKSMDIEAAAAGLAWLGSDIGQRIARIVLDNQIPEADAMQRYYTAVSRNPPAAERMAYMQRIADATGALYTFRQYRETIYPTMLQGFNTLVYPHKKLVAPTVNEKQAAELVLQWYLFLYRKLSDNELEPFLRFLESNDGRRFEEVLNRALFESEQMAAARLLDLLTLEASTLPQRARLPLNEAEQKLRAKVDFDDQVFTLLRSYSFLLGQLKGHNGRQSYDAKGLTLSLPSMYGYVVLETLRQKLRGGPYAIYYLQRHEGADLDKLAIIKSGDPYDYLALVGVNGDAQGISHQRIIGELKKWEAQYGMQWLGAGHQWLEVEFKRPPPDLDAFTDEVLNLCPGLLRAYGDKARFVRRMRLTNRLSLSWPE